ncbi:hypothetical protein ACROYT_G040234 [Oculina patagonica]
MPTRKSTPHNADIQALENSGINPKDVMDNKNVVGIHKYKRLYSRNSAKFVRIHNGKVDGSGDKHELNVKIKLESLGSGGQIILKSYDGSVCLCFDKHGTVVAQLSQQAKADQGCVFFQDLSPKGYTRFRSKLNKLWYLAITKDGRTKSARKTFPWQRSVQFVEYN